MQEKGRGKHRLLGALHYYYHCYLIHFLLGISGCSVLFLLLLAFTHATEGTVLSHTLLRTGGLHRGEGRTLSCALLEGSVYSVTRGGLQSVFATADELNDRNWQNGHPQNGILLLQNVQNDITRAPLPTGEERAALYTYDKDAAREGERLIIPTDLSLSSKMTEENGGILFSNRTEYPLDAMAYLEGDYPLMHESLGDEDAPLVLIIHTHGTESFAEQGAVTQDKNASARSTDTDENIVSVGAVLAATLREAGIGVIHCETCFDKDSYNNSYIASAAYVREMLAMYPSIAYVFDVHRDALESADGAVMRPVTYIGGSVAAQVMLVVGTDAGGGTHPDWEKNLTVAVQLQKRLLDAYPSFARPINVRDATFNAQYATGSLLIEIGASGNSVKEAQAAAYYLGLELVALISEHTDITE